MEDFSIITPVLNDKDNLLRLADRLEGELDNLDKFIAVIDEKDVDLEWDKARVLHNEERVGKAHAVNQGLKVNNSSIIVLLSSDIELEAETLHKMVEAVSAGADLAVPRITTKEKESTAAKIYETIWSLHHHVSLQTPKAGEAIAFRPEKHIPENLVVDEEFISSGRPKKQYISSGKAVNFPPASLKQLYIQRRRIFSGHLHLQREREYISPTNNPVLLLRAIRNHLNENDNPDEFLKAAVIEFFARLEGFLWAVTGTRPWKWQTVKTVQA